MQPKKAFSVNYKRACSFLNKPQTEKKKWVIEQHLRVSDRLVLRVAVSWLQKKESQRIVREVRVGEEIIDGQYAVLLPVTGTQPW